MLYPDWPSIGVCLAEKGYGFCSFLGGGLALLLGPAGLIYQQPVFSVRIFLTIGPGDSCSKRSAFLFSIDLDAGDIPCLLCTLPDP
jgi:hypothetical protein